MLFTRYWLSAFIVYLFYTVPKCIVDDCEVCPIPDKCEQCGNGMVLKENGICVEDEAVAGRSGLLSKVLFSG